VADPLDSSGAWLHCALHAHTTNSEGALPPEMLVRITLLAGRMKGSSVNAGRPGYTCRSEVLESDDRGLVTAAGLQRPAFTPYGRLELRDADGGRGWTNPLWVS
jgi:hypothetical protein